MSDAALYFPYIEVPDSPALTRVLLYWDELGSIIPGGVEVSPRMKTLGQLGLVRAIDPSDAQTFDWRQQGRLLDEFQSLVTEYAAVPRRLRSSRGDSARSTVQIHVSKGEWRLWRLLADHGLATIPEETEFSHRGWVAVDREIGGMYLALLAISIGQSAAYRMDPVTDQPEYFNALRAHHPSLGQNQAVDLARGALLRSVLPAPEVSLDPADLADFKYEHHAALHRLRRRVEATAVECAREPDATMRQRLIDLAAERLTAESEEVRRRMVERRWPSVRDGVCAVLQGTPGLVSGVVTGHPLLSTTGAVPLAIELIKSAFGDRGLSEEATVYAVFAQDFVSRAQRPSGRRRSRS